MKIFGIGTDIVNIKRLGTIIKKDKSTFKSKIFSKTSRFGIPGVFQARNGDRKRSPFSAVHGANASTQ